MDTATRAHRTRRNDSPLTGLPATRLTASLGRTAHAASGGVCNWFATHNRAFRRLAEDRRANPPLDQIRLEETH